MGDILQIAYPTPTATNIRPTATSKMMTNPAPQGGLGIRAHKLPSPLMSLHGSRKTKAGIQVTASGYKSCKTFRNPDVLFATDLTVILSGWGSSPLCVT